MNIESSGTDLVDFQWDQLQQINYPESSTETVVHACHGMIYAKTEASFLSQYPCRAWVLMQMRFDGTLGFPGGFVSDDNNEDASLEDGLNRELVEELALDIGRFAFSRNNHVVSHFCSKTNVVLNFYAQEVTEDQFKEIEMAALSADEYGLESLGIVRIPLYTMQDSHRGLPLFLQNRFAGASVLQVIAGLCTQGIINLEELKVHLPNLPKHPEYHKLVQQAIISYSQEGPRIFPQIKINDTDKPSENHTSTIVHQT